MPPFLPAHTIISKYHVFSSKVELFGYPSRSVLTPCTRQYNSDPNSNCHVQLVLVNVRTVFMHRGSLSLAARGCGGAVCGLCGHSVPWGSPDKNSYTPLSKVLQPTPPRWPVMHKPNSLCCFLHKCNTLSIVPSCPSPYPASLKKRRLYTTNLPSMS